MISDDEKYLMTSSTDGTVKVFEKEYLRLVKTLKGNGNDITMILMNSQNKKISFTDGKCVFIYDL